MEHKNIDRLFQEQLKNLEATPNSNVWSAIESKLAPKKRRVLPMWWFSGGVTALLVLSLLIFPFPQDKAEEIPIKTDQTITIRPGVTLEKNNNLKPFIGKERTKGIVVVANEKSSKKLPESRIKSFQKTNKPVLIADKTTFYNKKNKIKTPKNTTQKHIEKEADLVQKNAMKKVFTTKDSLQKKEVEKTKNNPKEEFNNSIIKQKKDFVTDINHKKVKSILKRTQSKWSISPVVASINSFSESSSSDFASNPSEDFNPITNVPKNKESNISYGININYRLYKKWTVQTGIHFQKIKLNTNNVYVSTNQLTGSISYYQDNPTNFTDFGITSSIIASNASLKKTYSYIEVPLEIKYRVFSTKKFSTKLVAGFSTLFLTKNNTIITASSFVKDFGKDSNLNTINFSGNIGFDFNYSLGKKWKLSVNPMLKKQLNTFQKIPKNYNSFLFGLYTGIKYQF